MKIRAHAAGHALGSRAMAVLLAVSDEGSLRAAARRLGVSVAAVSKSVRATEERLGAPIFDRMAAGVRPTDAGQALLAAGREALRALSAAETAFRESEDFPHAEVRLGCGPFPAPAVARLLIPAAKQRWPRLRLSLDLGSANDLLHRLARGELDIAICHIEDLPLPPGLDAKLLQTLASQVLVRPGHPLLAGAPVDLPALASYGLAGFKPYSRFLHWYRRHVGQDPDFMLMGPDFDILAESVARSDMLLFASHYMYDTLSRSHGLAALPVTGSPFRHEVYCITNSRQSAPGIAAVSHLIHELLTQSET